MTRMEISIPIIQKRNSNQMSVIIELENSLKTEELLINIETHNRLIKKENIQTLLVVFLLGFFLLKLGGDCSAHDLYTHILTVVNYKHLTFKEPFRNICRKLDQIKSHSYWSIIVKTMKSNRLQKKDRRLVKEEDKSKQIIPKRKTQPIRIFLQ